MVRVLSRWLSSTSRLPACPKALLTSLLDEGTFQQRDYAARLTACGRSPSQVAAAVEGLKAVFHSATRGNASGTLSLSGVADAIRAVKELCPLAKAALDSQTAVRHFEQADTNNDGVLSLEEFNEYVIEGVVRRAYAARTAADSEARRELSQNALIERRVAELVPGISESGMHRNRLLLFGGSPPEADAVLMRSNDYLSLSGHPEIAAARAEAMVHEGRGVEARARVFTIDEIDRHRALELRMAELLQAEDATLTMSGAHAVVGLLKTLRGPAAGAGATPIYADRLSWTTASLRHDLGLNVRPFAHNQMEQLHSLAADEPGVIVVDALYGNGELGDLRAAAEIALSTGSVLVVDETHAFGCAGGGLGLVDELGLAERVHFRTIGFSKVMAARGGVIVGPSRALEAFRFNDPTMIFSTAPKPHEAVGWDAVPPRPAPTRPRPRPRPPLLGPPPAPSLPSSARLVAPPVFVCGPLARFVTRPSRHSPVSSLARLGRPST